MFRVMLDFEVMKEQTDRQVVLSYQKANHWFILTSLTASGILEESGTLGGGGG